MKTTRNQAPKRKLPPITVAAFWKFSDKMLKQPRLTVDYTAECVSALLDGMADLEDTCIQHVHRIEKLTQALINADCSPHFPGQCVYSKYASASPSHGVCPVHQVLVATLDQRTLAQRALEYHKALIAIAFSPEGSQRPLADIHKELVARHGADAREQAMRDYVEGVGTQQSKQ